MFLLCVASLGATGARPYAWWDHHLPATARRSAAELRAAADAQELTCTERPEDYRRLLAADQVDAVSAAGRTVWAAQVLDFVSAALMGPDTAQLGRAVAWEQPCEPPIVEDGYVRHDGAFRARGRAPVPAYLFLPEVPADALFLSRGAVIVIHGHDNGRKQVVERPHGYQRAIAVQLARAGFVVLAADNVTWGRNDPRGDGKGKHHRDWARYMRGHPGNGQIAHNVVDLHHAITLLAELRVAPDPVAGRWVPATPEDPDGAPAVHAIGVSGLSYGAQVATYLFLDPRPRAYVISCGLIDRCDVKAGGHHRCQAVEPFEGVVALWDLIVAGAVLARPQHGGGFAPPFVQVQQGMKDKILRVWGKTGLAELGARQEALGLDDLELVTSAKDGHNYLGDELVDFFRRTLR